MTGDLVLAERVVVVTGSGRGLGRAYAMAVAAAGAAVVVRALPGAADREYRELAADLDAALVAARNRRPRRSPREAR